LWFRGLAGGFIPLPLSPRFKPDYQLFKLYFMPLRTYSAELKSGFYLTICASTLRDAKRYANMAARGNDTVLRVYWERKPKREDK